MDGLLLLDEKITRTVVVYSQKYGSNFRSYSLPVVAIDAVITPRSIKAAKSGSVN